MPVIFDMILGVLPQSNSPGNELRDYFSSTSISQKGTRNYWGIKDKTIDDLIEKIITAESYDDLTLKMRVFRSSFVKG